MNRLSFEKFPQMGHACAEAINTLCTNLTFSGENVRKIMLTSCYQSEGKTYLSMHTARTLASLGYKVALVEADLRKGVIASRYKIEFASPEHTDGLAQYLAGRVEIDEVLYATDVEDVYIVPVGRNVANSLQLLNSPRFSELMDELASRMDYVIVDAPPIGQVIDAAQIAKSCDGMLLAVKYNTVRRKELIAMKDQLQQTGCPILGTVLNQVEYASYMSRRYYYRYYYYRYYDYGNYGVESKQGSKHGHGDGRKSRRKRILDVMFRKKQ